LREATKELTFPISDKDQELIDKMVAYIDESCNNPEKCKIDPGIAIAAPQVGLDKNVIYINFVKDGTKYTYLIANPKIASESMVNSYLSGGEGCLSVKNKHQGVVKRKYKIVVNAYDLINKENIVIEAKDFFSICLQHEMDHLKGILYYDRINQSNPFYVDSS
jgi:peptide deformylase